MASSHSGAPCSQLAKLPLQYAAASLASEAVVQALLYAHPEAAQAKDKVRPPFYTAPIFSYVDRDWFRELTPCCAVRTGWEPAVALRSCSLCRH